MRSIYNPTKKIKNILENIKGKLNSEIGEKKAKKKNTNHYYS